MKTGINMKKNDVGHTKLFKEKLGDNYNLLVKEILIRLTLLAISIMDKM